MEINKKQQGKKNRANGSRFELLVRKDLESKGWIVSKWTNNVEFQKENTIEVAGKLGCPYGKIVPAKRKYNPFNRAFAIGTGFPDFIAYSPLNYEICLSINGEYYCGKIFDVIFIECKINGRLDKQEKEKAKWYLENNLCSKFLVASKTKVKNKIVINYEEFK